MLDNGEIAILICLAQGTITQQLGITEYRRHRGADFMADIRQELALGLACLLRLTAGIRQLCLGVINAVHHGIEVFRQSADLIITQHRHPLIQRPASRNGTHRVMHQVQTPEQHRLNPIVDHQHGKPGQHRHDQPDHQHRQIQGFIAIPRQFHHHFQRIAAKEIRHRETAEKLLVLGHGQSPHRFQRFRNLTNIKRMAQPV